MKHGLLRRLETRIILQAAAAALLPMLALAIIALFALYSQQVSSVEQHLQELCNHAREIMIDDLAYIEQTLQQVSTSPDWLPAPERLHFDHLLAGLTSAQSVSLVDQQGRFINGADRTNVLHIGGTVPDIDPVLLAQAHRQGSAWGEMRLSPVGEPLIRVVVSRPSPQDGAVRTYLTAVISLRLLWDAITTLREGDISQMVIVDSDGTIIAHPDYSLVLAQARWDNLPSSTDTLASVSVGIDGEAVIGYVQPIAATGWQVVVAQDRDQALAPVFDLFLLMLAALVVTALASAVPGLWIARQVTQPVSQLSADAVRVGQGDLQVRSDIQRDDEIGQLAGAFNQMVASLEASTQRLNQTVDQRTQELRAALNRAEESDQMKTAFLGTVTHELRTPLASIKGFAETLLADDVEWDRETQADFLRTIVQEADRLHGLVNQLLDMTRIESGGLQLHLHTCHLDTLFVRVERRLQHLVRNHLLDIILPEALPPVCADPDVAANVVHNLVENAVKYTPPGTSITISAQPLSDGVQVSVHDDGPGIPQELQGRLFQRFSRGDHPNIPGTGLGLAICKGLIERHGGRIWLDSADRGGTTFHFVLPYTT
ncbi:MAG: ATP-binding protein [Chloroflexota bacterium]